MQSNRDVVPVRAQAQPFSAVCSLAIADEKKHNRNMSDSNGNGNESARVGTSTVKQGLAQMLKGGVIVSVFLLGLSLISSVVVVLPV